MEIKPRVYDAEEWNMAKKADPVTGEFKSRVIWLSNRPSKTALTLRCVQVAEDEYEFERFVGFGVNDVEVWEYALSVLNPQDAREKVRPLFDLIAVALKNTYDCAQMKKG